MLFNSSFLSAFNLDIGNDYLIFFSILVYYIIAYISSKSFESFNKIIFDENEKYNKLAKEKFLLVDLLCHEIKVPLTMITNTIESIDNKSLDELGIVSANELLTCVEEVVSE